MLVNGKMTLKILEKTLIFVKTCMYVLCSYCMVVVLMLLFYLLLFLFCFCFQYFHFQWGNNTLHDLEEMLRPLESSGAGIVSHDIFCIF